MATKRIIELTEGTAASGDYVMTDSSTAGTKKVELVDMVDNAIDSALEDYEPADGSIDADMLAADAVTTVKMADNAVTKPKLSAALRNALGNVLRGTATGAVVSAHGTYSAPPLGLTVDGKSVQDGTPTPSAPVAIDSVESVSAVLAGKNLFSDSFAENPTSGVGVTATYSNGIFTISGTPTAAWRWNLALRVKMPAGTYTVSVDGTLTNIRLRLYDTVTASNVFAMTSGNSTTFVITDEIAEHPLNLYWQSVSNNTAMSYTGHAMIEVGSQATAWEPASISTTSIDLDGHELRSLPDGTCDELRVDEDGNVSLIQRVGSVLIDGVNKKMSWLASNNFAYTSMPSAMGGSPIDYLEKVVTSHFPFGRNDTPDGAKASGGNIIFIAGTTFNVSSAAEANTWFQSHNTTVLYALATPVTVPLGTVTLPELPAPDLTAWAVTDPSTAIALDYERDLTIAIGNIEAAIADLATS